MAFFKEAHILLTATISFMITIIKVEYETLYHCCFLFTKKCLSIFIFLIIINLTIANAITAFLFIVVINNQLNPNPSSNVAVVIKIMMNVA